MILYILGAFSLGIVVGWLSKTPFLREWYEGHKRDREVWQRGVRLTNYPPAYRRAFSISTHRTNRSTHGASD